MRSHLETSAYLLCTYLLCLSTAQCPKQWTLRAPTARKLGRDERFLVYQNHLPVSPVPSKPCVLPASQDLKKKKKKCSCLSARRFLTILSGCWQIWAVRSLAPHGRLYKWHEARILRSFAILSEPGETIVSRTNVYSKWIIQHLQGTHHNLRSCTWYICRISPLS